VVTLLEIGGLLAVLWVARASLAELPAALPEIVTPAGGAGWAAVLSAGVLAFYAFLGFEDMVNVAEEVRDVRRVLPLAIVITLVVTAVLYAALATVCVLSVPPEELAESEAPLALVFSRATGASPAILGAVGVIALVNGALIQIVMAARVLYGLARDHRWLAALGRVHPVTRTPLVATVVVSAIVLVLAIAFPLEPLARTTSLITLVVFAAVNLALIVLKRRGPPPEEVSEVPAWVPLGGFAISLGFVAWELRRLLVS
jgi:amino acid transporter